MLYNHENECKCCKKKFVKLDVVYFEIGARCFNYKLCDMCYLLANRRLQLLKQKIENNLL